jgi:CelD/BcsL family acetyltransferase involved in cellulose biosynthesis
MPLARSYAAFDTVTEFAPARPAEVNHRQASAAGIRWGIVSTRDEFDALGADWDTLFARAGRPHQVFQTFGWNWHWCNHYLHGHANSAQLAIVTARRGGELILVWPLVLETNRALRTLSWMGEPVSQYGDVLIDDVADPLSLLRQAYVFIRAELKPDVIVLRKVRADANIAPFLAEAAGTVTANAEAPFLELSSAKDFEAYYQSRHNTKARRNHRRLSRRLEEVGEVSFETHAEGERARHVARAGIAMKRRWLHDRGLLSPAFLDERLDRFFADVASGRDHSAGARVFSLNVDGAPAAIQLAFESKGRLAVHVMTYDLELEKRGVGVLNLLETVRRGFDLGHSTIDLLAPRADYKMEWASGTTVVSDHAVPLTVKGVIYARFYLGMAKPLLKTAFESLPLSVRQLLARKAGEARTE